MPDAELTLYHLSSLGISQSILSASKQDYLEHAVYEYGLGGLFFALNGLDNHHAAGKVEVAKAFIARHSLDPSDILLIGDTLHDAQVAAVIGTDCYLVPNGHHSLERLANSGAQLIASLAELR